MKKPIAAVVLIFSFFLASPANAAVKTQCKDNFLDNLWDIWSTLGQDSFRREETIIKNQADRAARCEQRIIRDSRREVGDHADPLQKKLGIGN